jgi:hypothetical protein
VDWLNEGSDELHVDLEAFENASGGFATPEEAARGDIPPRYARVEEVRYLPDGRLAKVTLLTNDEPYLYPYYVWCVRDSRGLWHEAGGSN